ncbi:cupin domain-containing protein [Nocardia stercoris]|uniref:Cupin domain-containing protein n=1 Tax=Nocardia stercoris TaxID=2483361 RepID=A0A3M2L1L8_9NOCA|nr:cupin domain-containing protein [Nocardia stercoris]RMI29695.1 cupin domain-containing protein [Nocardia stercoris]
MTTTWKLDDHESLTLHSCTTDRLDMVAEFGAGGHEPPAHWHPAQDEYFEVLDGTIAVRLDGRDLELKAGDTLRIPAGAVHQMWNPHDEAAHVRWQVTPSGRTAQWFRSIDALHRRGQVRASGRPGLLAYAVLLTEFRDVFRPVVPAAPLVRVLLAALAPIGRMRGYRAETD